MLTVQNLTYQQNEQSDNNHMAYAEGKAERLWQELFLLLFETLIKSYFLFKKFIYIPVMIWKSNFVNFGDAFL